MEWGDGGWGAAKPRTNKVLGIVFCFLRRNTECLDFKHPRSSGFRFSELVVLLFLLFLLNVCSLKKPHTLCLLQ